LRGKRVLVTGGGTGLGLAMGRRFLELGASLVICGRREQVLRDAAADLEKAAPGRIAWHVCDIRDAAAVDAVLGIVLHGSAYVTLGCGKRWLAEGRRAGVLSIVTTYAWTGSAYVVPSAMAKAGVLAMTQSLAVEWGGRGVRLNAIAPGPFPTKGAWERLVPRADLAQRFETKNPLGRVGRHEELANLASFLLSDGAGYINGEVVTIDGGEWLQGAGQFNFLSELTDADWQAMKPKK
jgi:NAD(P)-dependent dehydrogenase (short-subunit alcohol dehydrogenase family)